MRSQSSHGGFARTKPVLAIAISTALAAPISLVGQVTIENARATPETPRITAIGTGSVTVYPDRAVMYLAIQTDDAQAVIAASNNAAVRQRVIDTLATLGYSVDSMPPNAYAVVRNPMARGGPTGMTSDYVARAGLQVTVHPLDRLDEAVEAALWAGVEDVPAIIFQRADHTEAQRAAIGQAAAAARASAEAMAAAAGGRLGRFVHITNNRPMVGVNRGPSMNALTFGRLFPTVPSDLTVTVTVQIEWEFVPDR